MPSTYNTVQQTGPYESLGDVRRKGSDCPRFSFDLQFLTQPLEQEYLFDSICTFDMRTLKGHIQLYNTFDRVRQAGDQVPTDLRTESTGALHYPARVSDAALSGHLEGRA